MPLRFPIRSPPRRRRRRSLGGVLVRAAIEERMLDAGVSSGGMGGYSIEGEFAGVGSNGNGDGLTLVRCAHAIPTLIEFYSSNYRSSAPREGWIQRIRNGQITIDGVVVRDPSSVLRFQNKDGSRAVYHRLPWKEPEAPHLLPVLYEDDDMVESVRQRNNAAMQEDKPQDTSPESWAH